jgi:hypothetical protein
MGMCSTYEKYQCGSHLKKRAALTPAEVEQERLMREWLAAPRKPRKPAGNNSPEPPVNDLVKKGMG